MSRAAADRYVGRLELEECIYSLFPRHFGRVLLWMLVYIVIKVDFKEFAVDMVPLQPINGNSGEGVS